MLTLIKIALQEYVINENMQCWADVLKWDNKPSSTTQYVLETAKFTSDCWV